MDNLLKKGETGNSSSVPLVTICVLTYGDYFNLAKKTIDSIFKYCNRTLYQLVAGANAVSKDTLQYLTQLQEEGEIDKLHLSETNINKNPMMRRMFEDITTEYIWWFDDDSYIIESSALERRLELAQEAPTSTVIWGHQFFFGNEKDFSYGTDVVGFVKKAPWYRGKEPPSCKPGGKGEFNFEKRGVGDGRWFFITGGNWFIRTYVIRKLDWPDPHLIKRNDDVFLCEAIRQYDWSAQDIGPVGVVINSEPRRGEGEDRSTMEQQMNNSSSEVNLTG